VVTRRGIALQAEALPADGGFARYRLAIELTFSRKIEQ
jgi:hypothetical protein